MKTFEEKKFNIPNLKGTSEKTVEEHIKLYSGYVKNANTILAQIDEYSKDSKTHAYAFGEIQRRFGFELGDIKFFFFECFHIRILYYTYEFY